MLFSLIRPNSCYCDSLAACCTSFILLTKDQSMQFL